MNNNQINGQKNNKEAYCPNPIFNNGTVSIGEFKTIEDAMNFPMQEIWCINRTQDNKFNSYVSQGCRLLIICDWGKSIQDSQKFVVALISKSGKITYWDLNDLPINTRQYENSIDNDVLTAIYAVADKLYRNNNQTLNCNRNMNKKLIRLTENDLHKIVKESVIRVLNEKLVYRNAKFYTPTPIPSDGGPMYNDTFAFKEFQKLIDGCNRQLKFPVLNRKQGIDASEFLIQQFENWVNEYGKYIVSNQPIGKLIKGSGIQNKFGKIEYVKGDGGYARIFADCVNSGTPYYDEVADTFDPYPNEEAYF